MNPYDTLQDHYALSFQGRQEIFAISRKEGQSKVDRTWRDVDVPPVDEIPVMTDADLTMTEDKLNLANADQDIYRFINYNPREDDPEFDPNVMDEQVRVARTRRQSKAWLFDF